MSQRFSTTGNQPALFGIEVAVQLTVRQVVELFQDQPTGLFLGQLAAYDGENAVGFGETFFERGFVLVQGSDLFLVVLVGAIEICQLGVHLPDQFLALCLELVATQALELELEFQFIGFGFQRSLAVFDALFNGSDGLFLRLQVLQLLAGRFTLCCP